jgi:arsenate reductase (glutaredoxin)
MTVVRIFHNPRCSKSREALALLQAQGLSPEVIDYLKTPPSLAELQDLLTLLDQPARELLRSGEEAYRALRLDDAGLSEQTLLEAIAAHPQLLQRPIVVNGQRALIARPPELALRLL